MGGWRQGSQCWRHAATRNCFLKSTTCFGKKKKKRKKSIYKNLFTYKILKKVQGKKTQCEEHAQIRSVCVRAPVHVCGVHVHACACVLLSVCVCEYALWCLCVCVYAVPMCMLVCVCLCSV